MHLQTHGVVGSTEQHFYGYLQRTEVGSAVGRLTPEIYAPTLSTRSLRLQVYESKLLLKLEPLSNDDELLIPLSIDP
jgi:hypothetical protein